jgi:hypothetical protein
LASVIRADHDSEPGLPGVGELQLLPDPAGRLSTYSTRIPAIAQLVSEAKDVGEILFGDPRDEHVDRRRQAVARVPDP